MRFLTLLTGRPLGLRKLNFGILILLFTVLLYPSRPTLADRTVLKNPSTLYSIELYANGSALWKVTYSVPLLGNEDIRIFEDYADNFTASKEDFLAPFEQQITGVVKQASDMTGRNMSATDFDASATITGTPTVSRGTITYRFLWLGFLDEAENTLYMGDAFEGGLYLYENDSIKVIPPSGYRASFISPQPDAMDGAIVWHGPKNFSSGEPAIQFTSMETKLYLSLLGGEITEGEQVTLKGRIEPPLAVPINITYTRPDGGTHSETVTSSALGLYTSEIVVDEAGTWEVQASWEGNGEYLGCKSEMATLHVKAALNVGTFAPFILLGVAIVAILATWLHRKGKGGLPPPPPESDEERVLSLLRSAGGQMYQGDIGRALKFSKSKTTMVLNNLEARNLIEKEKRGRRYLAKLS